jgi:ELWxxDGT repeat protein
VASFPSGQAVRGAVRVALGDALLFFATAAPTAGAATRWELWRSDGSVAGTGRVGEHAFLKLGGASRGLPIALDGALWLRGEQVARAAGLWRSDGTDAGTLLVAEMPVEWPGALGQDMAVLDNRLYFRGADAEAGSELWSTDGTPAGTARAADLWPGLEGSAPGSFVVEAGALWFHAADADHGRELWRTDGTEAGTWQRLRPERSLPGREPVPARVVRDRSADRLRRRRPRALWGVSMDRHPSGVMPHGRAGDATPPLRPLIGRARADGGDTGRAVASRCTGTVRCRARRPSCRSGSCGGAGRGGRRRRLAGGPCSPSGFGGGGRGSSSGRRRIWGSAGR